MNQSVQPMVRLTVIYVFSAVKRCKHMTVNIFSSRVIRKSFQKNRKIHSADNLNTAYARNNYHNHTQKMVLYTLVLFLKVLISEKEYCFRALYITTQNVLKISYYLLTVD